MKSIIYELIRAGRWREYQQQMDKIRTRVNQNENSKMNEWQNNKRKELILTLRTRWEEEKKHQIGQQEKRDLEELGHVES